MNIQEMPTRYSASEAEPRWGPRWEASGLQSPRGSGEPYCITIPPPNITGSLHMGHALLYAAHDALGRYWRLRGRDVLILPGQDHAGIATQSVVDKKLRSEGTSAAAIGREAFIARTWAWRKESGDTIVHQLKSLGCAFDWTRLRFTLDEGYAQAVLKVFIDWYDRGLVFRGERIVNWDPKLGTTVSDIETVRMERAGKLYHVRYPFEDGSGAVTVATTRPETILGDVAVAVHPGDERYRDLVGRTLVAPLTGRRIPLLADLYPDPAFGTGALKITPAHDANDFAVGERHGLARPTTIDARAKITLAWLREHEPGLVTPALEAFEGLDRFAARGAMVEALRAEGALAGEEDHTTALSISDRSGDVIEPLLSEQWFVAQAKLAAPAIEAVRTGDVRFAPSRYDRIFTEWMEGLHDWCVSRQLWWGHRIPVYYTAEGEAFPGLDREDAQRRADEKWGGDKPIVRQDDDVLDTWFSSGLWPFAVLGWPESTDDLARYYPTDVLLTDKSIINLWVARMMMTGFDVMGEKPFADVAIIPTVLTEKGERMSKSKGNGVDPMDVMAEVGTDALRYVLLSQTGENQDLRFRRDKVTEGRNFANKIWNAVRFALGNLEGPPARPEPLEASLEPVDRWILGRLKATEAEVRRAYEEYDMQGACAALYRFFWDEVCDWTIEIAKGRLADPATRETPQWVLLTVVSAFLTMLHPVMPHVTEELWSYLPIPGKADLLLGATWPDLAWIVPDPDADAALARAIEATRALRTLRAELEVPASAKLPLARYEGPLEGLESIVQGQARIERLLPGRPEGTFVSIHAAGVDLHLPTEGVDVERILAGIARERETLEAQASHARTKLANEAFVARAKPELVVREREGLASAETRLARLEDRARLFAGGAA